MPRRHAKNTPSVLLIASWSSLASCTAHSPELPAPERIRPSTFRSLDAPAVPNAPAIEHPDAGATDVLAAWGRTACAEANAGNLVARAVPEESDQVCYRYPPSRSDGCERKIEIQVANCGPLNYNYIRITETYRDYADSKQLRHWDFNGIGPAGVVSVPIPIPVAEQRGHLWVNRPPPPEHHYWVFAGADGFPQDETQVVAFVRDTAFEAAQKQYCLELPDTPAIDPNASESAKAPAKNVVELVLARSACFGRCPAYIVSLRTDGTVVYEGKSNVRVRGRAVDRVAPEEVLALVARFDAATAEAPVRRSPRSYCPRPADVTRPHVTMRRRGRELRMPLLGHCDPPHESELADEIDRTARTERWVTGSKECRDRGLW